MAFNGSAPRRRRAQSFRYGLLALVLILCQCPLIVRQVRQKSEPPDAIGGDPVTVNDDRAVEKLAEVIPVEIPSVLEFLDQARGIESIPHLPELQHQEAADQRLFERPGGEHAEIVDVARLVALIAGADFLREDFGQRKADNLGRRKWQQPEITLLDLRQPHCRQRRRFAAADLDLHLAHAARVPVMGICPIDSLRQRVFGLVVAIVGNGELDSVKWLLERRHHFEDDILMIVLLDAREIEVG
jgi:hypothetical protein